MGKILGQYGTTRHDEKNVFFNLKNAYKDLEVNENINLATFKVLFT